MAEPVPGQKRHLVAAHPADGDRGARLSVGGFDEQAARARASLSQQLEREGLELAGWREVPTDSAACGEEALRTLPRMEMAFVNCREPIDEATFNRRLFLARRRTEKALEGRSAGDKFDVVVSPEEGYGTPNEMLIQVVPREAFQGVDELEVGMQFQAQTPQGAISVVIAKIEDGMVTVDGNHPLAGQNLNFAIEVIEVREASVEEVLHGHVHGAGGHHH